MILGDKLRIREAEQPDNIIWENKDVKGIYKKFIQLKYKIIMTIVIFIVAASLVKLKNYTTQFDDLYPNLEKYQGINCTQFNDMYETGYVRRQAAKSWVFTNSLSSFDG